MKAMRMRANDRPVNSALNCVGCLKAALLRGLHHFSFIFWGAPLYFGFFYYPCAES